MEVAGRTTRRYHLPRSFPRAGATIALLLLCAAVIRTADAQAISEADDGAGFLIDADGNIKPAMPTSLPPSESRVFDQLPQATPNDTSSFPASPSGGNRRLKQIGVDGSCRSPFWIHNTCRKSIWVVIGVKRSNQAYTEGQPGWETHGWYEILPRGSYLLTGSVSSVIFSHITSNEAASRLSTSERNPAHFCIAGKSAAGVYPSFRITSAANKRYFRYSPTTGKTGKFGSCRAAGGQWVSTAVQPDCRVSSPFAAEPGLVPPVPPIAPPTSMILTVCPP